MAKELSYCEDPALIGVKEIPFWLQILAEHAALIKSGLSDEQLEYKQEAQAYATALMKGYHQAEQVGAGKKITYVLRGAIPLMKDFLAFQQNLLTQFLRCCQQGWLYPLLLDHMIRENLYALKLFEMFLDQLQCMGKIKRCYVSKPQENLFWVEIASNHAQFVDHWTDPSERNVIDTAQTFHCEFDQLYLQGKDYVSMMRNISEPLPAFERYFMDVRKATVRFKDFLKLAEVLIRQCQLLGVMPASLADHLRRETEYDLLLTGLITKGKICPCVIAKTQDSDADTFAEDECESPFTYESPLCDQPCSWHKPITQAMMDQKVMMNTCDTMDPCDINDTMDTTESAESAESCMKDEPCEQVAYEQSLADETCLKDEMEEKPCPVPSKSLESKKIKTSYSTSVGKSNYQWKSQWPRPLGKNGH